MMSHLCEIKLCWDFIKSKMLDTVIFSGMHKLRVTEKLNKVSKVYEQVFLIKKVQNFLLHITQPHEGLLISPTSDFQ